LVGPTLGSGRGCLSNGHVNTLRHDSLADKKV
jgi:hypothetical protein